MSAQVDRLRKFMGARAVAPWQPSTHAVAVIAGAAGGVGTSVIASLLALATAAGGRRTLLIDCDEVVGTLHHLLDAKATRGISALRDGDVSLEDCLTPVSEHCFLVAGGHAAASAVPFDTTARRAVMRRLALRFGDFDAVIIDAGSRLDGILAAAEPGFSRLVIVSGVSPISVASAYAIVKSVHARWHDAAMDVLFNRTTATAGRTAFDQVLTGARQFLRREVGFVGAFPHDAALAAAPDVPLRRCSRAVELATEELTVALFPTPAVTLP